MKYFAWLVSVTLVLFQLLLVTPVHALSDNVVIYQVQTGSPASASQEIILLLNISANPVNISDWCLVYSSASNATTRTLACIDTDLQTEIWLSPSGLVSFASGEFVIANPGFVPDYSFSSGLAATGGHVWIENNTAVVVDKVGWGSATAPEGSPALVHSSGNVLSRNALNLSIDSDNNLADFSSNSLHTPITSGLYEEQIIVDLCPNISEVQTVIPDGYLQDESGDCFDDVCPNLDELQKQVPIGYKKISVECTLIPLENSKLLITELLPNASSSDTGKEFIEIYNPNLLPVNLTGYIIQVGSAFSKQFVIQSGVINTAQYITFSDTESKIVLPNTNGVQLRLVAPNGDIVSETPVYINAPDDSSWSLFEDQWIYSNQPSPNSANKPYIELAKDEEVNSAIVLAPCPIGKYRNPETNRCRNLETAVSTLKPCDEDEYRNPETNRCRKFTTATSLAACGVGQERNPETNRCRKVATLAATDVALSSVDDVQALNTKGQVNWPLIFLVVTSTFCYIIYEWRYEIRQKMISVH